MNVRRIVAGTAAVISLGAVGVASAAPADAAAGVNYCFTYSTGARAAGTPTYLQVLTSTGWTNVASDHALSNGCGGYTMTGTYRTMQARVVAQQTVGGGIGMPASYVWIGATPLNALAGNATVDLGTGVMSCIVPATGRLC